MKNIIDQLDALEHKSLQALEGLMNGLEVKDSSVERFIPSPLPEGHYHRNLLHHGEDYEIVMATWPIGAQTWIHDHGTASSQGMVRVVKGEVFNHVYKCNDRQLSLLTRESFKKGDLIPVPPNLTHAMGNHSSQTVSMSLHIYTPQIINVSYWDPESLNPIDN